MEFLKKHGYKVLAVLLLFYTIIGGLLGEVPRMPILNESIRNLYFHVPMWFSMMVILTISVWHSVKYLVKRSLDNDIMAEQSANVGVLLGILGLATGSIWAKVTWGTYWTSDAKLNNAAIMVLVYLAYILLRNSIEDPDKKARISAVYNIFAFSALIPLLFILPRMTDSLHPGNGGNPGFNSYDLDNNMRKIFYPAVLGWILLGIWITNLSFRVSKLKYKKEAEV
jgi:heme exporter protein C